MRKNKDCGVSGCPLMNLVDHAHHSLESDGTCMIEVKVDAALSCKCAEIMAADETRHFRGCPLREKYPDHPAAHEPADFTYAAAEANRERAERAGLKAQPDDTLLAEAIEFLNGIIDGYDFDESSVETKTLVEKFKRIRDQAKENERALVDMVREIAPLDDGGIAVRFGEKGFRTWKSLAEEANDLCAKRFDEIEQLKKLVEIYKAALMEIAEKCKGSGALAVQLAHEALSPATFGVGDPRMSNAWASKEAAPPAAVEHKFEPGPTVFDHDLEIHRKRIHSIMSSRAESADNWVADALWFLLAVAHQPGESELEERVAKESADCVDAHGKIRLRVGKLEARVEAVCGALEGSRRETAMRDGFARAYGAAARYAVELSQRAFPGTPEEAMAAQAEIQKAHCVACGVPRWNHPGFDATAPSTHEFIGEYDVWYLCPIHGVRMPVCCEGARRQEPKIQRTIQQAVRKMTPFEHDRPRIVCLCGSTKFAKAFADANLEETLKGNIVLTVGSMTHSDDELGKRITPEIKTMLDNLHKKKIGMADEVLVLNAMRCEVCGGVQRKDFDNWGHHNWCQYFKDSGSYIDRVQGWAPYIGESTKGEIEHALRLRKHIRFLNPQGRTGCTALFGNDTSGAEVEDTMHMLGLREAK